MMNSRILSTCLVSLAILSTSCSSQKAVPDQSQTPEKQTTAVIPVAPKKMPIKDEVVSFGTFYRRTCTGEHGLVFVVDKSSSGPDSNHFGLSRSAILSNLDKLTPSTRVSVVAFDTNTNVLVKNAKMDGKGKSAIVNQLNKLVASGKPEVISAMETAADLLDKGGAQCKSIVLLSDGRFPLKRDKYLQIVKQLRKERVAISGLVVSDRADRRRVASFVRAGLGSMGTARGATAAGAVLLSVLESAGVAKKGS